VTSDAHSGASTVPGSTAKGPKSVPPEPVYDEATRYNYERLATMTRQPCPSVATRAVASDAGADDPFGCTTDGDCTVSACGALNRKFAQANQQKMAGRQGCPGGCQGQPDQARCRDGICVVPSDSLCSPGLLVDAGPPEELGHWPPDPGAALSIEERLFVLPDFAARASSWLGKPDFEADAFWTPTFDEVIAIDTRVKATFAASCDDRARRIARRLPGYRGQFVGIVKGGRRLIGGNYFCSLHPDPPTNLTLFWVVVFDGGECFFHFWYDPATGTFLDISINGYA
jgi:hypothetical protein